MRPVFLALCICSARLLPAAGSANESIERSRRELQAEKYLVFPEGSNVQLVYCLTITSYAKPSGDYNVGVTAGQAWELPSRSTLASDKPADYHRRSRRQLYRKVELLLGSHLVHTAGIKARCSAIIASSMNRSTGQAGDDNEPDNDKRSIKPRPACSTRPRSRGKDGKGCVLKAICDAATRDPMERGRASFLDEIVHAVFTLPEALSDDDDAAGAQAFTEYERAFYFKENCDEAALRCPGTFAVDGYPPS